MKKILLLSDTHGHIDERMLLHAEEADEIWHAGDIGNEKVADLLESKAPLKAVWGNIDGDKIRIRFKEHLSFECEGMRILMIHIAGQMGKYNRETRDLIIQYRPDVLVCGHSHILKIARKEGEKMLHINPGAAGISGFHNVRTMVRFNIDAKQITTMEVIELGPRSKSSEAIG